MAINLRNKKTGAEIHLALKKYPTDKPFQNLKNLAVTSASKALSTKMGKSNAA